MRTFKFRYTQSGATKYKTVELPDDAVILRGHFIDKSVLKHFALISPLTRECDKNFFLGWLNRRQEEVDPLNCGLVQTLQLV